jgi:hypothetical protein
MLTMLLAYILDSPTTGAVVWDVTTYLQTAQAVRADRHESAERLGRWLDQLDGERIRAAARYSPFADDYPEN